MTDLKRTARGRENVHYMIDAMRRFEWDAHHHIMIEGRIPPEWHEIARERGRSRKERITTAVEVDVLRFFRSMGKGYQERMNDVLRTFMHARLAGLVDGPETADYMKRVAEGHFAGTKPDWGGTEKELAEISQRMAARGEG